MRSRYDVGRDDLASLLVDLDQPAYRLDQIWEALYVQRRPFVEMTNVPEPVRDLLDEALPVALTAERRSLADDGETTKWLWRLHDGTVVESVLMRYDGRSTVCVSSQAGCAMGCGFCATGQMGFDRHLSPGEIVEQVIRAADEAAPERLSNVVFMGMGEPLANYDATRTAITRIHDDLGISARHLTVSTVGVVPGIRSLAEDGLPVTLAVSLHAANDRLRNRLVPINRRYPLSSLVAACHQYRAATGRRVSFEWALIAGVNDRPDDADELGALSAQVRAHVNLIPLNPTPAYDTPGTTAAGVRAFRDRLRALGVNATVRRTRGRDIDAACGQLAATAVAPPARTTSVSARGR